MTVTTEATKWPEFMTIPEVASVLRVSKMTVYRMVHKGAFDYRTAGGEMLSGSIRAGRSFRIRSSALDAYIKGSEVTA
jgi:excisionase family DNA binding protein